MIFIYNTPNALIDHEINLNENETRKVNITVLYYIFSLAKIYTE